MTAVSAERDRCRRRLDRIRRAGQRRGEAGRIGRPQRVRPRRPRPRPVAGRRVRRRRRRRCRHARELAERCDVVITCLPNPAASAAVVEGPDGLLAGWSEGKIWLEMSTTDEAEITRLGRSHRGGRGRAGRLPGVGRVPPCGDGQHLDLRGLRAFDLRTRAAAADGARPSGPAHRPARDRVSAEGGDQLSRHREPDHPRRGTHHDGRGRASTSARPTRRSGSRAGTRSSTRPRAR